MAEDGTGRKSVTMYDEFFCKTDVDKPYRNTREHLEDLFCVLDAYLNLAYLVKEKKEECGMRGLSISEDEIATALISHTIVRKGATLSRRLTDDLAAMFAHIGERVQRSREQGTDLRFLIMAENFQLTCFEQFCLILSIACDYNRNYEVLFSALQNDSYAKLPSKGLAVSLYELTDVVEEWEVWNLINEKGTLWRYLLFRQQVRIGNMSKLSSSICVKERVIGYLLGSTQDNAAISDLVTMYDGKEELPELLIHQDIFERIKRVTAAYIKTANQKNGGSVIHIHGQAGIGKRFVLKHVAKALKIKILFFDIVKLLKEDGETVEETLSQVLLESVFSNAVLCLLGADISEESANEETARGNLLQILRYAKKEWGFFYLLSERKSEQFQHYHGNRISMELPMLTAKEKILLWEAFQKDYELDSDVDVTMNGNKYILTVQGILDVLNIARCNACANANATIRQEDILSAVKQRQGSQLGDYATLLNAVFTWEDLIVDVALKQQMKLICSQLKYRNIVGEDWGFDQKMPYGKGVSALFYGAPGTGKTMAVQVMANELGLDLYRIDLSQLVSKYIGETEKNITGLFKKAKNINALLFFDEADSLFAKRTEVKDSHDRNANMMTSHLLQKLEDYDGITILATNYINNIDEAFKRRIKFMVNFVFPSAETRYELWREMLPMKAKCSEEVDLRFFAEKFELSGSSIKEILVNAAYIAASEHAGIANRHIVESVRLYFAKYGKLLTEEDFEYFGHVKNRK